MRARASSCSAACRAANRSRCTSTTRSRTTPSGASWARCSVPSPRWLTPSGSNVCARTASPSGTCWPPGSARAASTRRSCRRRIVINDFNEFFARHRGIRLICFNGNTAAGLYRRKVQPGLAPEPAAIETAGAAVDEPGLRESQASSRSSSAGRPRSAACSPAERGAERAPDALSLHPSRPLCCRTR